jgi:hypothetical protein
VCGAGLNPLGTGAKSGRSLAAEYELPVIGDAGGTPSRTNTFPSQRLTSDHRRRLRLRSNYQHAVNVAELLVVLEAEARVGPVALSDQRADLEHHATARLKLLGPLGVNAELQATPLVPKLGLLPVPDNAVPNVTEPVPSERRTLTADQLGAWLMCSAARSGLGTFRSC